MIKIPIYLVFKFDCSNKYKFLKKNISYGNFTVIKIPIYLVFKFDCSNKYKFLKKNISYGNFATFFECLFLQFQNRTTLIYIYIYIYIYIFSSTDRMFRSVRTLRCDSTSRTFEAGIESRSTLH